MTTWQPSLFGQTLAPDRTFGTVERVRLDDRSWVEHGREWLQGSDALFASLVEDVDWDERERWMYGRRVAEPRLTARQVQPPFDPPILDEIRELLSARYRVRFDSLGCNLYRDGRDSVAWHKDRIRADIDDPIVALVSLGAPRTFRMRPRQGIAGATHSFSIGHGDLLVTGGRAQRDWEHAVPKAARVAGPRISLAYRHGLYE